LRQGRAHAVGENPAWNNPPLPAGQLGGPSSTSRISPTSPRPGGPGQQSNRRPCWSSPKQGPGDNLPRVLNRTAYRVGGPSSWDEGPDFSKKLAITPERPVTRVHPGLFSGKASRRSNKDPDHPGRRNPDVHGASSGRCCERYIEALLGPERFRGIYASSDTGFFRGTKSLGTGPPAGFVTRTRDRADEAWGGCPVRGGPWAADKEGMGPYGPNFSPPPGEVEGRSMVAEGGVRPRSGVQPAPGDPEPKGA